MGLTRPGLRGAASQAIATVAPAVLGATATLEDGARSRVPHLAHDSEAVVRRAAVDLLHAVAWINPALDAILYVASSLPARTLRVTLTTGNAKARHRPTLAVLWADPDGEVRRRVAVLATAMHAAARQDAASARLWHALDVAHAGLACTVRTRSLPL